MNSLAMLPRVSPSAAAQAVRVPPLASSERAVVLSLDFELRWGSYDKLGLDMNRYRANLEGVREVVPALLRLFTDRGLRATWAAVGALACRGWDEYFRRVPFPPAYRNPAVAFDPGAADLDPAGRLHFAPDLLDAITAAPGQELGSHTFAHIPLREPGVTEADVAADLQAACQLWEERFGFRPQSLVFPRNQPAFLDVVRAAGIRVWRGNPQRWYYDCNEAATNRRLPRLLRLQDDLSPWTRHSSPFESGMTRASLFLRTDLPAPLWKLHVGHIDAELRRFRPGEVFHLYWHPHNLGTDTRRRLDRVRHVLDRIAERVERGDCRSVTMGDLAREDAS